VDKSALGRVTDPSALDACEGPRARLAVEVPAAWLAEGADLVIAAPARLTCARCDGGGCDACGRTGALKSPAERDDRLLHVRLPSPTGAAGEPQAIALRIPDPFGAEQEIAQLLLEVRPAEQPSASVSRIAPLAPLATTAPSEGGPLQLLRRPIPLPIFAVAVIAAVLFALFGR
jgi:hypothetical protein